MRSVWSMSNKELYDLINNGVDTAHNRLDIGDITVVCHTCSQSHKLQRMMDSVRVITDKIIIFDDNSQDDTIDVAIKNGCEVYSIPEGWLYTHGFGKLIEYQVKVCKSAYHFQVDTGEVICVPEWASKVKGNIAGNLWMNNFKDVDWNGPTQIKHNKYNRLLNTGFKVVFPAYIHGAPLGVGSNSTKSDIIIVQEKDPPEQKTQYYTDRHTVLYNKLLKKGFYDRKLENNWWYNHYKENKTIIDNRIIEAESRIGVLEETNASITKIT